MGGQRKNSATYVFCVCPLKHLKNKIISCQQLKNYQFSKKNHQFSHKSLSFCLDSLEKLKDVVSIDLCCHLAKLPRLLMATSFGQSTWLLADRSH